jgi:hypothetical protein
MVNWLFVQNAFAIICCCLPVYRPILPSQHFINSIVSGSSRLLHLSTWRSSGSSSGGASYRNRKHADGSSSFASSTRRNVYHRENSLENGTANGSQVHLASSAGNEFKAGASGPMGSMGKHEVVEMPEYPPPLPTPAGRIGVNTTTTLETTRSPR